MKIHHRSSAIVLIEFQNQWTEPGLYHSLIRGQLETRSVVHNTRRLVEQARPRGFKIVHAPLVIDRHNKRGWLAHLTFGTVFTFGTRKAEIASGLCEDGDLLVKGRYAFDAFVGSDLEQLLRCNGIDTLFLAGFTTDQCVAKTLRTALHKGFDAYLISDCTATLMGVFQQRVERSFRGHVLDSRRLLDGETPAKQ
jgi:ureidoacrylate peracid hydrolase